MSHKDGKIQQHLAGFAGIDPPDRHSQTSGKYRFRRGFYLPPGQPEHNNVLRNGFVFRGKKLPGQRKQRKKRNFYLKDSRKHRNIMTVYEASEVSSTCALKARLEVSTR